MVFRYHSGEEIQAGDRVRLDGRPAQIEFVADPDAAQLSLYVEEFGAGVMVAEHGAPGQVFFSEPEAEEDLEFVERAPGA
jgi:hypothetical protein